MEKTNEIDRSRNSSKNANIYKYFNEEEILQLTDKEFEILQTKLKSSLSGASTSASFYNFHEGSGAEGLKGDETALNIYKRIMAAHHIYFPCFYRYSRVFSLCHALEVNNLYDIGCGSQLQALLLIYAPKMNYTGIDPYIFQDYPDNFFPDPSYINELFESFTIPGNNRIEYIKETYPCDLTVAANNIAITLSTPVGRSVADERRKNITAAISRDFERIVFDVPFQEYNLTGMNIKDIIYNEVEVWTNPFEKYYCLWKNAVPEFEFYKIGERNYIFGTKVSDDIEKLKKHYTFVDNQFMTGVIDIPFHNLFRF